MKGLGLTLTRSNAAEVAEVTEQEPSLEEMIGMESKVAEMWVGTLSTCFNCKLLGWFPRYHLF